MDSSDPALHAGPILISILLAYFLYGAYITHLFRYVSLNHPENGAPVASSRVAVSLITVVEIISMAFLAEGAWFNLVQSISNSELRRRISPTSAWEPFLGGLMGLLVHLFVQKVYVLGRTGTTKGLSLDCSAICHAIRGGHMYPHFSVVTNSDWLSVVIMVDNGVGISVGVHLASTLACDLVITANMIIVLARFKRLTVFSATKRTIHTLTIHTVENGLVTTILAFFNLVFYFARQRQDSVHFVFHYALPRVYANVMIISLNNTRTNHAGASPSRDRSNLTSIIPFQSTKLQCWIPSTGEPRTENTETPQGPIKCRTNALSRLPATQSNMDGGCVNLSPQVIPPPSTPIVKFDLIISVSTEVRVSDAVTFKRGVR